MGWWTRVIVLVFLMLIVILLLLFFIFFLIGHIMLIQHTPHLRSYYNTIFIFAVIVVIYLLFKCVFFLYERVQLHMHIVHIDNTPRYNNITYRPPHNNITYRSAWGRRVIAIDTESVGAGPRGNISMLARVSLVTLDGKVFDRYVQPVFPVTDYRTRYSGIREEHLVNGVDYSKVREFVANYVRDSVLVGHDIKNDLNILNLRHPSEDIRDISTHKPLRDMVKEKFVEENEALYWRQLLHLNDDQMSGIRQLFKEKAEESISHKTNLKLLAKKLLKRDIQIIGHCSIEDARATMDLYELVGPEWEMDITYGYY